MANSNIMIERLKQNVGIKSGCSVLFLKALKSDLARILKEYMAFEDIEFDISEAGEGYLLGINVSVKEFFDIGKGE